MYKSLVSIYYLLCEGQTKSGSLSGFLCGKERFKYLLFDLVTHSCAIIPDFKNKISLKQTILRQLFKPDIGLIFNIR